MVGQALDVLHGRRKWGGWCEPVLNIGHRISGRREDLGSGLVFTLVASAEASTVNKNKKRARPNSVPPVEIETEIRASWFEHEVGLTFHRSRRRSPGEVLADAEFPAVNSILRQYGYKGKKTHCECAKPNEPKPPLVWSASKGHQTAEGEGTHEDERQLHEREPRHPEPPRETRKEDDQGEKARRYAGEAATPYASRAMGQGFEGFHVRS